MLNNDLVSFVVTVLKLNTATIRWYNISTATFSHLSMRRTYRVKVEALSQTGELIFAAAEFYSPGNAKKSNLF